MIITILRKPLEGTVAENTLKHGCGALNIDATRVKHNEDIKVIKAQETGNLVFGQSGRYEDTTELKPEGRWPANFILTHKEGCEIKGNKKIKGHKGYPNGPGGIWSKEYQDKHQKDRSLTDVKTVKDNEAWVGHADKDGKETISDWACVEGCPVQELDELSLANGMHSAGYSKSHNTKRIEGMVNFGGGDLLTNGGRYGDSGGASRFFKQFKKENDQ